MTDEHAASITTTMHSIATMLAGFQPPAAYAGRPLATVSDWDGFVRLAKLHTLTPLLHGVARACGTRRYRRRAVNRSTRHATILNTVACRVTAGEAAPTCLETVLVLQADFAAFDLLVVFEKNTLIQ